MQRPHTGATLPRLAQVDCHRGGWEKRPPRLDDTAAIWSPPCNLQTKQGDASAACSSSFANCAHHVIARKPGLGKSPSRLSPRRAVRELLAAGLSDPYTRLLSPAELASMRKYDMSGVGLNLGTADDLTRKTVCPRLLSTQIIAVGAVA